VVAFARWFGIRPWEIGLLQRRHYLILTDAVDEMIKGQGG